MELPPGARMAGVPHTPGTREYLTCERGTVELAVAGERYRLDEGDVVSFRGDQRHGYHNPGSPARRRVLGDRVRARPELTRSVTVVTAPATSCGSSRCSREPTMLLFAAVGGGVLVAVAVVARRGAASVSRPISRRST